jgi:hypothetical protein
MHVVICVNFSLCDCLTMVILTSVIVYIQVLFAFRLSGIIKLVRESMPMNG